MGPAISGGTSVVAEKMGESVVLLPISGDDPQGDLYHECHRVGAQAVQKTDENERRFPNENSLLKLLYLGVMNAQEKWTMPLKSWNLTLSQLAIYFEGRLDKVITL